MFIYMRYHFAITAVYLCNNLESYYLHIQDGTGGPLPCLTG